ncbi:TPA: hypothetical protein DEP94_02400 [Candidatus Nomurabacteria bacterium]|nr:hypothetical protein [Candidatus Nomurabacteria bacterium]
MKNVSLLLINKTKNKESYNLSFEGKDTGFLVLEKFKNGNITRYPFYSFGGDIKKRYDSILKITTIGGKKPSSGISTNVTGGFGFTKPKGIQDLFYFFQEKYPKINEIVFSEKGKIEVKENKLNILISDFKKIELRTEKHKEKQGKETRQAYQNIFNSILPTKFLVAQKIKYTENDLSNFFRQYDIDQMKLSLEDSEVIKGFIDNKILSKEILLSSKSQIDTLYVEDILIRYKDLMKKSTKEEEWQVFFNKNNWIFSNVFFFPVSFTKDKFNVGGNNITETNNDKIVDFLYKNNLTSNVAFIEIKTHKTPIVMKTEYRKGVFPITKDLSGSIIQVQDQKNELLKNFYAKLGGSDLQISNSRCVVIVGNLTNLNQKQKDSFDLFRMSNKEVEIITFDELLNKIEYTLNLFKKTPKIK